MRREGEGMAAMWKVWGRPVSSLLFLLKGCLTAHEQATAPNAEGINAESKD